MKMAGAGTEERKLSHGDVRRLSRGRKSNVRRSLSPAKVSIVIPVYNGARYLRSAVDSALRQTYAKLEVIVVNDGSSDDTEGVALSYEDRIKYITQENRGLGAALNAGIRVMTGEFFCWLSHDDVYRQDKIERQLDLYWQIGRSDIVLFTDYEMIDAAGNVIGRATFESIVDTNPMLALWGGSVEGSTVFCAKSSIDRFGAFDETLRFTADSALWMNWSENVHFVHMPECLVQKRVHADQLSAGAAAMVERDAFWQPRLEKTSPAERALLGGSSRRFLHGLAQFLEETRCDKAARRARELAGGAARPLVSIVLAVLNELELAERAIRSALAQSYPNIEVIVVVDKSAAGIERLKGIASEDPRVRVLRDDGRGPGAAKNLGIDLAFGEYIALLDHDDWFMPTKIAQQVSAMIDQGYLVSHTSYLAVYPARNLGPAVMHSGLQSGMLFPSIMSDCPIAATTSMIHCAIAAAGFRFSERYDLGADTVLWATIAREHRILGIDVPLTVIEWSDDTAAINLRKQRLGLKLIHDSYLADPVFAEFPKEIARLSTAMAAIDARLQCNADRGDTAELNADLIAQAFGRL
jgi:glycosyltransferase involved in cell wall biosynthesis